MKTLNVKLLAFVFGLSIVLLGSSVKAQTPDPEQEDTTKATVAKMYSDLDFLKRLKVTGYLQFQYQHADTAGQEAIGGNFLPGVDERFSVRRGRIKVTYEKENTKVVFETDLTERGFRLVDAYVQITETKFNWVTFKGGIYNRPFGFDVSYSSSLRESPERGRMSPTIFPNERDLGFGVVIQGPKTGNLHWLKLEAGLFTGMGSENTNLGITDFDNKKDFIGRLSAVRSNIAENIKYGVGVSFYSGGFIYANDTAYKLSTDANGVKAYEVEVVNPEKYNTRQYYGIDGQIQFDLKPGALTLRAEYIAGTQPASSSSTKSYQALPTTPEYSRKFNGAYFYLIQNIVRLKLQAIVKYDWYDQNTEVKGNEIGVKSTVSGIVATNATDIRYDTFGFGLAYLINNNAKIIAYYDIVKNETSANLSGYTQELKDDLFTLRFQYRF